MHPILLQNGRSKSFEKKSVGEGELENFDFGGGSVTGVNFSREGIKEIWTKMENCIMTV